MILVRLTREKKFFVSFFSLSLFVSNDLKIHILTLFTFRSRAHLQNNNSAGSSLGCDRVHRSLASREGEAEGVIVLRMRDTVSPVWCERDAALDRTKRNLGQQWNSVFKQGVLITWSCFMQLSVKGVGGDDKMKRSGTVKQNWQRWPKCWHFVLP